VKENSLVMGQKLSSILTTKIFPTSDVEQNQKQQDFVTFLDRANAWSSTSNQTSSNPPMIDGNLDRNSKDMDNHSTDAGFSDRPSDLPFNDSDFNRKSRAGTSLTPDISEGMQFDMDLILPGALTSHPTTIDPDASGNVGGSSGEGGMIPSSTTNNVIIEEDEVDETANNVTKKHVQEAIALMEKIETDRIPCPRLCGATFGGGVGRLVGMCSEPTVLTIAGTLFNFLVLIRHFYFIE
jgi:hypothetical protein